jgi:hypothetical protein
VATPQIPGVFGVDDESVAKLWPSPPSVPESLWPENSLRTFKRNPIDWVSVLRFDRFDRGDFNAHAVLIAQDAVARVLALDDLSWIGRGLGGAGYWDGEFSDGLAVAEGDLEFEFLCERRTHHDRMPPTIEIAHPYLWYWDAFRVGDDWVYLDEAGRDRELIRYRADGDFVDVQFAALELRRFLWVSDRALLVQVEMIRVSEEEVADRSEETFHDSWARFNWAAGPSRGSAKYASSSHTLGRYVVTGSDTSVRPGAEYAEKTTYPEFTYGVDAATGRPLTATSDPAKLGTYFDGRSDALHYLTPAYFNPQVLDRYLAEPSRYAVGTHRLRCLDLWSLRMGISTSGQVEAYLGDLGQDLPASEWPHWIAYNELPTGGMAEDRARRDLLGQWVDSGDAMDLLREAIAEARSSSLAGLGFDLWKAPGPQEARELLSLRPPAVNESRELVTRVILLTKVLVDAIDVRQLKAFVGGGAEDSRSLELLTFLAGQQGWDTAAIEPLRALQRLRSSGGVAHRGGSQRDQVWSQLKLSGDVKEAWLELCERLTISLRELSRLLRSVPGSALDQ